MARPEKHIFVCNHQRPEDDPKGCCMARGGKELRDAFAAEFEARNLWGRFKLNTSSCLGACEHSPGVLVYPEGVLYGNLTPANVPQIIEQHLLGNEAIEELKVPADVWE
ncbi:MAG: (2Fe-2S) ferredoxin domain-containing protein [Pseudomonadales bacterium]|nr:(2Fe-2S) ferredoxin domain-containing protein [Pseudomonadales bacterium]